MTRYPTLMPWLCIQCVPSRMYKAGGSRNITIEAAYKCCAMKPRYLSAREWALTSPSRGARILLHPLS